MAKTPKTRRWHIILARVKGVSLGTVEAAEAKSAVEPARNPEWRLVAEPME